MISRLEHIGKLIGKYLRHELTEEEQKQLNEWINELDDNKKLFEKWTDAEELMRNIRDWERLENDKRNVWQKMDVIAEKEMPRSRLLSFKWWKYAAAAVVMMAVAYFWIFNLNSKTNKAASGINNKIAVQKDIPPGITRAVLTLADGSKIFLDTAGNGKLADQEGITISNKNGQLVYKQNSTAIDGHQFNTLTTAMGETFVAQLADGTLAWLNAGSSIHYPVWFTGSERIVEITGEVYFEVKHDAFKPFHVKVNGMDIHVLGTHFNVNGYDDEASIKTTLLQGSIKISNGDKIKILRPGQQAQISNGTNEIGKDIRVISDVNTDEVIAWKNGFFNFDGVEIPSALRQLARWYNIDIVYEGEIPRDKFAGEMERKLSLSQVLKVLERAGLLFKVQGRKLIVKQQ